MSGKISDQPIDNAYLDDLPDEPEEEPESEYALPPTWSEVLGLLAGGGLDDVE